VPAEYVPPLTKISETDPVVPVTTLPLESIPRLLIDVPLSTVPIFREPPMFKLS